MSYFKDTVAPWIGVLAVLGFGFFVVYLLRHLGEAEPQWSRMVFIFGAVEAAGLAALGFFFGKEVNRARAEKAEDSAATAQTAAQDAMGKRDAAAQKLIDIIAFIEEKAGRRRAADSADDDWNLLVGFARRLAQ